MEPETANQTPTTDAYMTPARQEDFKEKLAAEEAFVEKWAQPTAEPATNTEISPTQNNSYIQNTDVDPIAPATPNLAFGFGRFKNIRNNSLPEQQVPSPTPQAVAGNFEPPEPQLDTYENYSTPYETSQEYATISLVLVLVSPLAGFIMAIVAIRKAKQVHYKNHLAQISLLVNLLFMILIVGFIIFLLTPTE